MKNGFRVLDSDLHTMEPDGLWERYLDEPFKRFAPRFTRRADGAVNQPVIRIGDLEIAEMSKRARTAVVGKSLQERAFARHPHYAVAHGRGYDAESHLQAMDIEGIDVAVIYGTRGRQVLMHDDLEPQVAAALARAHNDWTRDFCARDPARLKFAAQLAFHDVPSAVAEARRAVRELGAVAVIGNPNPISGRHVHDPALEPLWSAIEELGVPVGFHPTGQSSLRDDIARSYARLNDSSDDHLRTPFSLFRRRELRRRRYSILRRLGLRAQRAVTATAVRPQMMNMPLMLHCASAPAIG